MASTDQRAQELADLFGRKIDLGDQSSASYDDTRRITRQRRSRPDDEDESLIAYAAVYKQGPQLYLAGVDTTLISIVNLGADILDDVQVIIDDNKVYILVISSAVSRYEADLTATFDPFPTDGSLAYPNNDKDIGFMSEYSLYLPLKNKVKNVYTSKKAVLYVFDDQISKLDERIFEDSTVFDNSEIYARSYQANLWPGHNSTDYSFGFRGTLGWTGTEFYRAYYRRSPIGGDFYSYGLVAYITNVEEQGLAVGMRPLTTGSINEADLICLVTRIRTNQGYYVRSTLATAEEVAGMGFPPGATDPMPNPLGQNTPFLTVFTQITAKNSAILEAWPLYRLIGNKSDPTTAGTIIDEAKNVFADLSVIRYGEYIRYSYDNIIFGQSSRHPNFDGGSYFRPVVRFCEPATGRKYSIFGKSKFTTTEHKAWISEKDGEKIIAVGKFEYEQNNDHGDAPITPSKGLEGDPATSATGFSVQPMVQYPPTSGWPGDISRIVSNPFLPVWGNTIYVDNGGSLQQLYFRSGFHHTSPPEYNSTNANKAYFLDRKFHNSKAKLIYTSDFGDNFSCTYSLDEPETNRFVFIPGRITEDIVLPGIGFMAFPSFKSPNQQYTSEFSGFTFERDEQSLTSGPIFEKIGLDPSYSGVFLTRQAFPAFESFYYMATNPGRNNSILQQDRNSYFGEGQPSQTFQQAYDAVFQPLSVTAGLNHPDLSNNQTKTLRGLISPILKQKNTDSIPGLFFKEIHCIPEKNIFFTPGSVSYEGQVYPNDLESMKTYVAETVNYITSGSEPVLLGQFYNTRYSTVDKLIKNPYEARPRQTDFISYFYLNGGQMRPSNYLVNNQDRPQRQQEIDFDRFVEDNDVPIPTTLPDGTKIDDTFTPPSPGQPSETDLFLIADAFNLNATINLVMPILPDDP